MGSKEVAKVIIIRLDIRQKLVEPAFALIICSLKSHYAKWTYIAHLVDIYRAVDLLTDSVIGGYDIGYLQSGNCLLYTSDAADE